MKFSPFQFSSFVDFAIIIIKIEFYWVNGLKTGDLTAISVNIAKSQFFFNAEFGAFVKFIAHIFHIKFCEP